MPQMQKLQLALAKAGRTKTTRRLKGIRVFTDEEKEKLRAFIMLKHVLEVVRTWDKETLESKGLSGNFENN